jgi:ribosome-binding factor A
MAEHKRAERVADAIQREIAQLLYHRVKDPRLHRVTITGVDLSPDLRHARVFYCYHDATLPKEVVAGGLLRASAFIRRELGKHLHLRYLPELTFRYDPSFDYGTQIDRLLKGLHHDG